MSSAFTVLGLPTKFYKAYRMTAYINKNKKNKNGLDGLYAKLRQKLWFASLDNWLELGY